jgi:hypothetical protein
MSIMHNDRPLSPTLPYDSILGYEETVEGTPIPNPTLILEIELDEETSRLLAEAARAADLSLPRYVMQAAIEKAQRDRR